MRKPDDGLRRLFRENMRGVHWTTIETGLAQRGVPDLSGCSEGRESWIECKSVRRGWAVKFQPGQAGWLLSHERRGGRTFVAVRRRTENCDDLYLYSGALVKELMDRGLTIDTDCRWTGGPARWDWTAVRHALFVF